jgi:DNA-binding transcriptional LysR family regulator
VREVNLRGLDLNLLVLLDVLIEHRNVTRAAETAGLSQPAMSRALGRLRAMLDDPILARGAGGLAPTPKALALRPRLRALLTDVRDLVAGAPFEPGALKGLATIAATDHQTIMLLPRLMGRLSREAPGLDIAVVSFLHATVAALREGTVDLAFGVAEQLPGPNLRFEPLYVDRFVTLLRAGHPSAASGAWTAERFAALDHILVTVLGGGRGVLDDVLDRMGLERRIALQLPHFYAAMCVAARTDLVVTLPASIAGRYAAEHGLVARDPPFERPPFTVVSIWSEVLDADPANRWLRQVVREEAALIEAAGATT